MRTASDHLSADDASIRTPSRKSSVCSSSSVHRLSLSADDAPLVPTVSADKFESEHLEPSDVDLRGKLLQLQLAAPDLALTEDQRRTGTMHLQGLKQLTLRGLVLLHQDSRPLNAHAH